MSKINKLLGFYELKEIGIPSVKWNEYKPNETVLDEKYLWTIRTAVLSGDDFNLPRLVGAKAKEASDFANEIYRKYNGEALIVYYPYFIANKSGNIEVKYNGYVIESVKNDLWNLVSDGKCDQTIVSNSGEIVIHGERDFLSIKELNELLENIAIVRRKFSSKLRNGSSVLLEWSFAIDTDTNKNPVGDEYLVFYECRTLETK